MDIVLTLFVNLYVMHIKYDDAVLNFNEQFETSK